MINIMYTSKLIRKMVGLITDLYVIIVADTY